MTKRKNAKFVVFSAAICLILCCTLVLGNTYAWFTDSVENEKNIIQSGTLDVEMSYSDKLDGTYKDASEGAIFDYAKWEPGYTDVKYIKVENKGTLAFKYVLNLVAEEVAVNGVKLSEVIDVYMGNGVASRDDITNLTYVGTLAELMADADGAAYGKMLAGESFTYCIALQMKKEAGNEYQNLSIGDGISVQLYAEQYTHEEDSFGPDYDENAGLPVAAVYRATQYENTSIPWGSYGQWSPDNADQELEAAYTFSAVDTPETVAANPYKDWLCDYYVYADTAVPEGKLFLGGYYETFNAWVGFENPMDVAAGEVIPLLGSTIGGGVSNWTYEEIVELVGTFICGVADIDNALVGTTFTVELRLMNPQNPEEYYVINSTSYTFKNPSDLPVATVSNLDVPEQEMYIISDIAQGFGGGSNISVKPDAAFTFVAQDDETTIASNPYKDWFVDYYVSVNEPVKDGVVLVGAYGNWQSGAWYGFNVPAGDYTTAVPLLGAMTGGVSNWTYEEIVTGVGTFNCGVLNNSDSNNGKVMTVELRIMNPTNPAEYYVVSKTTHTFQ